ncbi:MAG: hypothetical protein HZB26_09675 [Candidatus Hydrogenedentes bacterium]|nr:hypothetical protein [Candidatus Hydrogenedentota bacterium]
MPLSLANGDMGAIIWGDGAPLKITLDKYDAWESREKFPDDVTYKRLRQLVADKKTDEAEGIMRTERIYEKGPYPTRLPMPRLELSFEKPFEWEQGRLHLATATAEISGKVNGAPTTVTALTAADRNVLVLVLRGKAVPSPDVKVGLASEVQATLRGWGYSDPEVHAEGGAGTYFQKTPSGYAYAIAWGLFPGTEPDTQAIVVSLVSSEENPDPVGAARALVEAASKAPGQQDKHLRWWADYWNRSRLTIPDARLEALYYIEMYKLGCVSRPGKLPVTLQGLWTLDGGMPPWSGDYHLDMNVQQSYWPIYTANRLELGQPLYDTFTKCVPRWRKDCQKFFGFDGIWAGCAIGPRGERIWGYSGVELWPGNAAWLAQHYWLHFLYSWDKTFLREQALPMLRLSFQTYSNLLEADADGKLHVPLSYSPEWGEGGFSAYCKDPTVDLALIRFLCGALLQSNEALGVEDPLTPRVKEVLDKLAPYPQRDHRLLISADTPMTHSHRHFSHLMAIHPLGVLTVDGSEDDRALIRNSLLEIRTKGLGEWTGWSYPWMSLIASRAGYGNTAWQMLDLYANAFITPNTFHVNGDPRIHGVSLFDYEPMTLEAGFGAAAAIMEMLLQSYNGTIRVFPTMPDRWHDAHFEDLRAEGAFVVTAKMAAGKVVFASIRSEAGRPCRVKNPFGAAAMTVENVTKGTQQDVTGESAIFDTEAGSVYLLYPAGAKPDAQAMGLGPLNRGAGQANYYGVKRLARF